MRLSFFLLVSGVCVLQIASAQINCDAVEGEGVDLRCFDLEATAAFHGSSGRIELTHSPSPFGMSVTADGMPRYDLVAVVEGLPRAERGLYVAWLTNEFLAPVARLGILENGTTPLGSVGLNKFRVLVSLETDTSVSERAGPLVLRGASPSSRLQGHDPAFASPLAAYASRTEGTDGHRHDDDGIGADGVSGDDGRNDSGSDRGDRGVSPDGMGSGANRGGRAMRWSMPPAKFDLAMPPGMMGIRPTVTPWLPADTVSIPLARPQSWRRVADGDTLALSAIPVRRRLHSRDVVMFGFNGEFPGPLIEVDQAATIVVQFYNGLPMPTSVHWHGIRLDNRFDGVPGVTQDPVQSGEFFTYEIHFPDKGIYWYHPHHREDIFQDLGLYGNLLVRPEDKDADEQFPYDREEVLLLDDFLAPGVAYGLEAANYALMGRFGNLLLINGEPVYRNTFRAGEVVRLYLTNVSNTRTFNLRFDGAQMQVVGSDLGMFEFATPVESIVIAPAERYVVDIRYPKGGVYTVTNAVQALDHLNATYFPVVDTLGAVAIAEADDAELTIRDLSTRIANTAAGAELEPLRLLPDQPIDHNLELTLRVRDLPPVVEQLMRVDRVYFSPVEWEGTMPMMNWASTSEQVEWILRDSDSGKENMDIDWRFRVGDLVRIRVVNDRDTFHAMQHPLHIHGQRFVVLRQDGRPNKNLVWKDTVLLPAGSTTDLLLEVSNPGKWMVHCHIAEHLESGMRFVFEASE